jgi:multidrug transporter EmrE-like cation transporter
LKTYDYSNFAISNSLWNAGSIIATVLVGYYYFKEPLNKYEFAGISLVIAGGILIGAKSDDKSTLGDSG